MMKGFIHQEDKAILNVHVPNNKTSIHKRQKLKDPKGEADKPTRIVGDSSTFTRQLIKLTENQQNKIQKCYQQKDLIDIYRTLQ